MSSQNNKSDSHLSNSCDNISQNYQGLNSHHKCELDKNVDRKNSINRLVSPELNDINNARDSLYSGTPRLTNNMKQRDNYLYDKRCISLNPSDRSRTELIGVDLVRNERLNKNIVDESIKSQRIKYESENYRNDEVPKLPKIESKYLISENIKNEKSKNKFLNTNLQTENLIVLINKFESENYEAVSKLKNQIKLHFKQTGSEIENRNIELDHYNNQLKNEIEKLKEIINNLKSENKFLNNLKIENENLKLEINKNESEINKYESENENLRREYIETNQLKNSLQKEIKKLDKKIINLESENKFLNYLKIENENLKLEINKNESEIKKYKSENENLQREYIETNQLKNYLQNEIEKLDSQIVNLETENENL